MATTTARRIFLQREEIGLALQIAVREEQSDDNPYLTWILYRVCAIYYNVLFGILSCIQYNINAIKKQLHFIFNFHILIYHDSNIANIESRGWSLAQHILTL